MAGIIGLLLLTAHATKAHASSSQDVGTNGSPLCFYWNFREFRDGLFFSGMLWEIKQHATWCNDGYGHFNGAHRSLTPTEKAHRGTSVDGTTSPPSTRTIRADGSLGSTLLRQELHQACSTSTTTHTFASQSIRTLVRIHGRLVVDARQR